MNSDKKEFDHSLFFLSVTICVHLWSKFFFASAKQKTPTMLIAGVIQIPSRQRSLRSRANCRQARKGRRKLRKSKGISLHGSRIKAGFFRKVKGKPGINNTEEFLPQMGHRFSQMKRMNLFGIYLCVSVFICGKNEFRCTS